MWNKHVNQEDRNRCAQGVAYATLVINAPDLFTLRTPLVEEANREAYDNWVDQLMNLATALPLGMDRDRHTERTEPSWSRLSSRVEQRNHIHPGLGHRLASWFHSVHALVTRTKYYDISLPTVQHLYLWLEEVSRHVVAAQQDAAGNNPHTSINAGASIVASPAIRLTRRTNMI